LKVEINLLIDFFYSFIHALASKYHFFDEIYTIHFWTQSCLFQFHDLVVNQDEIIV
jgi:hypothetical protein